MIHSALFLVYDDKVKSIGYVVEVILLTRIPRPSMTLVAHSSHVNSLRCLQCGLERQLGVRKEETRRKGSLEFNQGSTPDCLSDLE